MNKKILIGSIIAVAIIIGVSFTSVVGFQSVKSNVKASPLFTVRTSRAIDKESGDFTCDYVGKGEEDNFSIPPRNNRISFVLNFFVKINKINYDKLKQILIKSNYKLYQSIYKDDKNIQDVLTTLYQMNKDNIEEDNNVLIDPLATNLYTICVWFLGCIPYLIMAGIYSLLFLLFIIYLKITGFTTDPTECYTVYLPC